MFCVVPTTREATSGEGCYGILVFWFYGGSLAAWCGLALSLSLSAEADAKEPEDRTTSH